MTDPRFAAAGRKRQEVRRVKRIAVMLFAAALGLPGTVVRAEALDTAEGTQEEQTAGYEDILDRYKEGRAEHIEQGKNLSDEFSYLVNENFDDLGYCFLDLNGDGIWELLVGNVNQDGEENLGAVYDLYTLVDQTAVQMGKSQERSMFYLCDDGTLRQDNVGGALISYTLFYRFTVPELSLIEAVIYDAFTDPENPYFYSTELPDPKDYTPISQETAEELIAERALRKIEYVPITSWREDGVDQEEETEGTDTAKVTVDISAYFQGYRQLVDLLQMDPAEDWQFGGVNSSSYGKDGFRLLWNDGGNQPVFSMKNEGNGQVTLYGVRVGDSILDLDEKLLENGWSSDYKADDSWYYCSLQEGDTLYQEVTVDENNQVVSWYLCNWPQGEGFGSIYDQLRAGTWTEPMGAAAVVPDASLRSYILGRYDTDQDGYLSAQERDSVTEIIVDDYYNITSMRGIEYFPNLEKLMCDKNMIRSLDVSYNPKLSILTFNDNQVSQINLTNNSGLTELYCKNNRLTSLDVSRNPELIALVCTHNQLTEVDTRNNLKLEILEY